MQEQIRQEQEKLVKDILEDKQFERFSQIELQTQGASSLARRDVAEKVGLSSDQVAQIQQIQKDQMDTMRAAMQAARGQAGGVKTKGSGNPMREQMMKVRQETDAKIIAVLNPTQKKKWDSILGPVFTFK